MDWDQQRILELIDLLKSEPVIWNPKARNHNNRTAVCEAWQRIADSFSVPLPVAELKRKRNSLATLYRAYVRKIQESARNSTNEEDLYHPSWYAFDAMHCFMAPYYGFEADGTIACKSETSLTYEPMQSHDTDVDSETESSKSKEFERANIKRKRTSRGIDPLQIDKPNELCSMVKDYQFATVETDETDLFAQILVHKLKKMSKQNRLMATHEINNIVFKYEMKSLEASSVGTSQQASKSNE